MTDRKNRNAPKNPLDPVPYSSTMANAVPNFLQPAPIFHGKRAKEGHSAEDFLRIVDTMRKANPNTPDDQFIQQVAGYLRDDASQWFHRLLKGKLGRAAYETFLTDWVTFKNHFVQMFFQIRNAREQQVDLLTFKQEKDETAIDFVHRTYVAVNEVSERWVDQNTTHVLANHSPVVSNQSHAILHAAINTAELRAALQDYTREACKNFLTAHENIRDVDHTAKIAAKALSDSRMRAHAKELGRTNITISDFCDNIENKEISLAAGKSESSHKGNAASIGADANPPQSTADVAAAGAQKKSGGASKKNKKQAKGQPKQGQPAKPKTPCLLCKEWHRYADCPRLETARRAIGLAEMDAQETNVNPPAYSYSGNA